MPFAAYLARAGLAYASIKVYLYSIENQHSSCSQHNPYQKALTSCLEQVLQVIKKEQAITHSPRVRLPITTEIMARIFSVLQQSSNDYQSITLWAACCKDLTPSQYGSPSNSRKLTPFGLKLMYASVAWSP